MLPAISPGHSLLHPQGLPNHEQCQSAFDMSLLPLWTSRPRQEIRSMPERMSKNMVCSFEQSSCFTCSLWSLASTWSRFLMREDTPCPVQAPIYRFSVERLGSTSTPLSRIKRYPDGDLPWQPHSTLLFLRANASFWHSVKQAVLDKNKAFGLLLSIFSCRDFEIQK